MIPSPFGIALSFEVTFDANNLNVGMAVYDDSGSSPALVGSVITMVNVLGNTYRAKFTPTQGKPYIIIKSVYTDGTLVTLDTDYNAGSESIIAVMPTNPATQSVKKNTALNGFTFPMFNTDGSPGTGLTITAKRSQDGGSLQSCDNSPTEISDGFYAINLDAADLNANVIAFEFTATGAVPTKFTVVTEQ